MKEYPNAWVGKRIMSKVQTRLSSRETIPRNFRHCVHTTATDTEETFTHVCHI